MSLCNTITETMWARIAWLFRAGACKCPTTIATVPSGNIDNPVPSTLDQLQAHPYTKSRIESLAQSLAACQLKAFQAFEAGHVGWTKSTDISQERRKDMEAGIVKTEGIRNNLKSLEQMLYKVNSDPALFFGLGLDYVLEDFIRVLNFIENGETRSPAVIAFESHVDGTLKVDEPPHTVVDTVKGVVDMLEAMLPILDRTSDKPVLAIDTEGESTMIQIFVPALKHVFLVGVEYLRDSAFSTSATVNGQSITLTQILEADNILKLFFDCRGDSEVLYKCYGIKLSGVIDVQLMDLATRDKPKDRKRVCGFVQAVTQRMGAVVHPDTLREFETSEEYGKLAMLAGYEEAQKFWDQHEGWLPVARKEVKKVKAALNPKLDAAAATPNPEAQAPEAIPVETTEKVTDNSHTTKTVEVRPTVKTVTGDTTHSRGQKREKTIVETMDGTDRVVTTKTVVTTTEIEKTRTAPDSTCVAAALLRLHVHPFTLRPLPPMLRMYAMMDAYFLPVLFEYNFNHRRYNDGCHERVIAESKARVELGRSEEWTKMDGDAKQLAPKAWENVAIVVKEVGAEA